MAQGFNAGYLTHSAELNLGTSPVTSGPAFGLAAGGRARRLGLEATNAAGVAAPAVVALQYSTDGGANWVDVATLTGAAARGVPVVRENFAGVIPVGSIGRLTVKTADGTSPATGNAIVWAEIEHQPFNGTNRPSDTVVKTS